MKVNKIYLSFGNREEKIIYRGGLGELHVVNNNPKSDYFIAWGAKLIKGLFLQSIMKVSNIDILCIFIK